MVDTKCQDEMTVKIKCWVFEMIEMVYFKRSYLLLNPHSSANEENLSIREPLDAHEPGTVPLHRIDLLDAVEGDAPVDVGADPLLRRPILTHLAKRKRSLVGHKPDA